LTLRAKVNGVEKIKTQRIRAIPCKTDLKLLDDLGVRDALHDAITNAVNTNTEQKVYFYRRPDGSYASFPVNDPNANNCIAPGIPPFPSSDTLVLVGFGHTHQYRVGDIVMCPLPGALPTPYEGPPGHNTHDWERISQCEPTSADPNLCADFLLESVIIDFDNVYRSHPTDISNLDQKVVDRGNGQCRS